MPAILKKKQFWGALFGLGLLIFCLKDLRMADLRDLSGRLNLVYLIPAVAATFAFIICKGMRWKIMISTQKRIGATRAVSLYSAGQVLNIVMPVLTGQVGRVLLFSRKEGLRKTFIFSNILLEVLFDAISLIAFMLITSFAFVFPVEYRHLSLVIAGVTLAALLMLYVVLHFEAQLQRFGKKRFRTRWPGVYITIKKFLTSFTKGIGLLKSSQHMAGSMAYSLASWMTHMLVVWFLMLSFGFQLPFAAAAVVMIINTIVLMVPLTPGNAGTFELTVSASLSAFAVGRSDAVLFALALHMLDLLPMFVLGFYFLHLEKMSLRDIKSAHDETDIFDHIDEEGSYIEEEKV